KFLPPSFQFLQPFEHFADLFSCGGLADPPRLLSPHPKCQCQPTGSGPDTPGFAHDLPPFFEGGEISFLQLPVKTTLREERQVQVAASVFLFGGRFPNPSSQPGRFGNPSHEKHVAANGTRSQLHAQAVRPEQATHDGRAGATAGCTPWPSASGRAVPPHLLDHSPPAPA